MNESSMALEMIVGVCIKSLFLKAYTWHQQGDACLGNTKEPKAHLTCSKWCNNWQPYLLFNNNKFY